MSPEFLNVGNGVAVKTSQVPLLTFDALRAWALETVSRGGKVVQFFAHPAPGGVRLVAVLRTDKLLVASAEAPPAYPALTAVCEPFHLFEREIAEQFGIRPEGHPWLKMVRYHPNYAGKTDVFGNDYGQDIPGAYPYFQVEGAEVHEVAVGPVHAGVIEPGHFRFNCIGERVFNLEIQLGYQHRGVENLLAGVAPKRLPIIAEGIAGDTAVANASSLAQAVEALTGRTTDQGARVIRTIALELERLANHAGDLGALSGDVAFLPPANYFGRMRGDFLNMTLLLCGNRFGKGLVRPGGVRFTLEGGLKKELESRLKQLEPQVLHVIDLLMSTPSVRARFEKCGAVSREDANHLGLVGPAGRACGLPYDARREFPTEFYGQVEIPENAKNTGDVYARAMMRADEIKQSINIVKSLLESDCSTKTADLAPYELAPDSFVVTVNEAWRGELSHCLLTDGQGKIARYKVKDPSFHNWNGLSMSLRNTGISDFPLNNKSYNLSYCGYDL